MSDRFGMRKTLPKLFCKTKPMSERAMISVACLEAIAPREGKDGHGSRTSIAVSGLGGGYFARSLLYRSRQLGRQISGLWLAIPGVPRGYCSRRLVRAAQPRQRLEFARMGFRRSVSARSIWKC